MNTASQMPPLSMVRMIGHVEQLQDQPMTTRCPPGRCQARQTPDAEKPAYLLMEQWLEAEGLL